MATKVHYIKSAKLAELPVHGAYGGINLATGHVAMSVFSERGPLPKSIEYDGEDVRPDNEIGRDTKEGVVRNVTATLYFDINAAMSIHRWLGEQVEKFQQAHPELFDENGQDTEVK